MTEGVATMKRKRFEGSAQDEREDKHNAKRLGMSEKAYEGSSVDRRNDKMGQAMLDKKQMARANFHKGGHRCGR